MPTTADTAVLAQLRRSPRMARYFHPDGSFVVVRGGADGDPPDPATPPADPASPPPAAPPATPPAPAAPPAPAEPGFPADTPVADMKPEEQAAYWKDKARKHEGRATTASTELEKIKNANLSDTEKAIKEAEDRGRKAATEGFGLELAAAKLEAAGVPADKVGDLNLSSVLDTDGKVDPVKVAELAARHKATPAPTPGSADGGPQGATPTDPTLDEQIAAARKAGNTDLAIALNNRKLAALATG